jgi:hypothetical protein
MKRVILQRFFSIIIFLTLLSMSTSCNPYQKTQAELLSPTSQPQAQLPSPTSQPQAQLPSPTSQPVVMFVAAENSYTSFDIPAAIQVLPNSPGNVNGIAVSQYIYLGWNDTITIKLTTNSWEAGCKISLSYLHQNSSGQWMTELQGQDAIVSQTNPGRYEVTLNRALERGSLNADEGMYQINIYNRMSQTIHGSIIYSRARMKS